MELIIIIAIIVFLLMEHALAFWFVIVPLALISAFLLCMFFSRGQIGLGYLVASLSVLAMIVIVIMLLVAK